MLTDVVAGTHTPPRSIRPSIVLAALGVVFGDIGTSPLYSVQTIFHPDGPHPVPMGQSHVYGVVSLIFWSVMVIVTLTYVGLVMRADNDGEGGVMALIALLRRYGDGSPRVIGLLTGVGILGAALFFGDSMITPAISVLSAVEGMKVLDPGLGDFVLPATAFIISALFALQRHGTAAVGRFFGPVMVVWFAAIAACGVRGIMMHPRILRALSPTYALDFVLDHPSSAFISLAAIVLTVTGAEALYADMGHFGRRAITVAWLGGVLPALTLNYFGQGAELLGDESMVKAPFYMLAPQWAQLPMVILATAATVIASQAVITGAYSVASQAVQLGYLPRLRVRHTSESEIGQIYVPWINGVLLVAVLALVFAFRSSAALAYTYGMAVTGTITITTFLFLYIARMHWRAPMWLVVVGGGALLTVDVAFLAANLVKLVHGAWLPLLIALATFTVLTTWRRGSEIVMSARNRVEGPLRDFIADIGRRSPPLARVPGTAVFLNRAAGTAPMAMRANVEHNKVLHERVVVLSIDTPPVPRVPAAERIVVDDLGSDGDRILFVRADFGYMEPPDVPAALRLIEPPIGFGDLSYFLSRVDVIPGPAPTMARWRKRLFIATAHISADAAAYFRLPPEQTAIIGARIEV
ncbi:MAG TPA: KUP/HAK/KT family potassium transporter [Mycobacterium sp.]|nr:KUP/HAK/KT family potassium transporter [Mycobacterium sp.]HQC78572.1 KUP/HAK/KT family potassium transporter [Mycobacterium sp.]